MPGRIFRKENRSFYSNRAVRKSSLERRTIITRGSFSRHHHWQMITQTLFALGPGLLASLSLSLLAQVRVCSKTKLNDPFDKFASILEAERIFEMGQKRKKQKMI